ncbi:MULTISPECIES: MBL fold metallo-hydrolase [unclassified Arthrobacter]|uniref:MBL fold metallo-hydrolase n=1 Tax=unclassified Arthrobacter TaxID=235627 RepID=UPI000CE4F8E2|nr:MULTISPECIES: MBL fold metallo-hydrolase [unclassified Arthrobacter]
MSSAPDLPLCVTCGTQYGAERRDCPICDDERQYVPLTGQAWTTFERLRGSSHRGTIHAQGPGVLGIGCEPSFAIGQRALLIKAATGNVLWDCQAYLDDGLAALIRAEGGISAIAVSHPHFYTTMVEWAREFDAPVYLHNADRQWVGRPDPALEFWSGDSLALAGDLTLYRAGIHFPGGTVLHWSGDPAGGGALFSSDIINVIPDRTHVSFLYSYPNQIPERPEVVEDAAARLEPLRYDRLYGGWWDRIIPHGADRIVQESARRYLAFTRG